MIKAIILAAGRGTRLGELTKNIPKVMINIDGKPCLQHNIDYLRKFGITEIAINTHHLAEKIKEYFGNGKDFGVNIRYSYETELLGTSGSLNNFRDFFDETFIVVYGDVLHNTNITEMLKFHKEKKAFATLALDDREYKSGAVILKGEKVIDFVEKPRNNLPNSYVNSGIYILDPEVLDHIPEGFSDFGFDIFPKLLKEGKNIYGFKIGKVIDIGKPEWLEEARGLFTKR